MLYLSKHSVIFNTKVQKETSIFMTGFISSWHNNSSD